MAKPCFFPEANKTLLKPKGATDEECDSMHVFTDGQICVSCWELDAKDLETLKENGGRLYLHVWSGYTQPPVSISPDYPFRQGTN